LNEDEAFQAMKTAIDAGATFWNSGVYYGFGEHGEPLNLELIARFFTKYPELADKVFLSVKGGFNTKTYSSDGSPEFLRSDIDGILKALNGKKKLDLFEMGRVDKNMYFPFL
jgi:pyridoxine 4-dehydrogenase